MTFPVYLDLTHRSLLLVGGGAKAMSKLRLLVRASADVTVVAEQLDDDFESFAAANGVEIVRRGFVPADAEGKHAAFVATGSPDTDLRVARAIYASCTPVNVIDQTDASSFILAELAGAKPALVALATESAPSFEADARTSELDARRPAFSRLGAKCRPQVVQRLATEPLTAANRPKAKRRRSYERRLF